MLVSASCSFLCRFLDFSSLSAVRFCFLLLWRSIRILALSCSSAVIPSPFVFLYRFRSAFRAFLSSLVDIVFSFLVSDETGIHLAVSTLVVVTIRYCLTLLFLSFISSDKNLGTLLFLFRHSLAIRLSISLSQSLVSLASFFALGRGNLVW